MIKQTFYNLNSDKRLSILSAAQKEFSRVPLANAKIVNIIKEAGIPRGSFYQYFDTLNDAFLAVVEYIWKDKKFKFIHFLEDSKGDLLEASEKMFINEYDYFHRQKDNQLLKNILYTRLEIDLKIDLDLQELKSILEKINKDMLKIKNLSELPLLLSLIFAIIGEDIRIAIIKKQSKEDALKVFTIHLNFIKNGCL